MKKILIINFLALIVPYTVLASEECSNFIGGIYKTQKTTDFSLSPVRLHIDTVESLESSDSEKTRIYLVRHGQSLINIFKDENGFGLISGTGLEIPLTKKGHNQATVLGKKLSSKLSTHGDYVVVSSIAQRAKDTADHIWDELKSMHSVIRGDSYFEFCEQSKGEWEGKPKDEQYQNAQKSLIQLSAKDKFNKPNVFDAESYKAVSDRMLDGLRQVISTYPNKTIIIASHKLSLNALAFLLRGHVDNLSEEPGTSFPIDELGNCDILMLELNVGDLVENAKVELHIDSKI